MTKEITPICDNCSHQNPFDNRACRVFPKGIPGNIYSGGTHLTPVKGQTGKHTFTPNPATIPDSGITVQEFFKSSCKRCIHFNIEINRCPAFPYGIPLEILSGKEKHLEPIKGQENSLVFIPGKKKINVL